MSLETAFSAGRPIAASKMPITPATLRSDATTRAAPMTWWPATPSVSSRDLRSVLASVSLLAFWRR